jgi:hypothetical protein
MSSINTGVAIRHEIVDDGEGGHQMYVYLPEHIDAR